MNTQTENLDHSLKLVDATCQILDGDLTAASGEATPTLSAWRGILLAEGMTDLHTQLGNLKNGLEAGNPDGIRNALTEMVRLTRSYADNAKSDLKDSLTRLASCLEDAANNISSAQGDMINSASGPTLPTAKYNQGEDGDQNSSPQGEWETRQTGDVGSSRQAFTSQGHGPNEGQDENRQGHPSQAEGEGANRGNERSGKDSDQQGHPSQAEGSDDISVDQGMGGSQLGTTSDNEQAATAYKAARSSYELNWESDKGK